MHELHAWGEVGEQGCQKEALDPLELQLQVVESHSVCWELRDPLQEYQGLITTVPSLSLPALLSTIFPPSSPHVNTTGLPEPNFLTVNLTALSIGLAEDLNKMNTIYSAAES